MLDGRIAFAIIAIAIASPRGSGPAHAQEVVGDGAIPDGYERIDVTDVTLTLRDDNFTTVGIDDADPRIAYLGTAQGRFYKSTDRGLTWTESTIIAEKGLLWATPGSSVFFGGIRNAGASSTAVDLIGARPSPIDFARVPGQLPRLPGLIPPQDALAAETTVSALGGVSSLGMGLSARSPRLSLLTAARGRGVPNLNRTKLLAERSFRGSAIFGITVHPENRQLLFAATADGLYKSHDGGESWTRSFPGLVARIALRPGTPRLMVLGTLDGAHTSIDDGESWTKLTTVGGVVTDVVFDLKDRNFVYLGTNGGVMRSSDGGRNFEPIYYSTFPAEAEVKTMVIDPFEAETLYIGTARGAYVTRKARTASLVDWEPLGGVQSILEVVGIGACSFHQGHIYALARARLHTINYGASPPESSLMESWDGGRTWRQLFTGQSDGHAVTFSINAKDPDQLMVAWSSAVFRVTRATSTDAARHRERAASLGPPLGEVVLATLRHHDLEVDEYKAKISRDTRWILLPRVVTVTGTAQQWSAGGVLDDAQFAANRYLQVADAREWQVMAWASWNLPEFVYSKDSVPMLRQRVTILNDELRRRLVKTVRRSYGELLRIEARLAATQLDLKTRVIYRLRVEQLEAVVDLASGGYLTRWRKRYRRNAK